MSEIMSEIMSRLPCLRDCATDGVAVQLQADQARQRAEAVKRATQARICVASGNMRCVRARARVCGGQTDRPCEFEFEAAPF